MKQDNFFACWSIAFAASIPLSIGHNPVQAFSSGGVKRFLRDLDEAHLLHSREVRIELPRGVREGDHLDQDAVLIHEMSDGRVRRLELSEVIG